MKNSKTIVIGIVILFTMGFIYSQHRSQNPAAKPVGGQSADNQPAAPLADGDYYVQIARIDDGADGAALAMKHITYFTGNEAYASARDAEKCDRDIVECVPTLKNGYYIRPSGAPEFTATATNAKILLSYDKSEQASRDDLKNQLALPNYAPAFRVTLAAGRITRIEELTRYRDSGAGGLPRGYAMENYQIAKNLETACRSDNECETPMDYLVLSSCPYTAICLDRKCAVICPDRPEAK